MPSLSPAQLLEHLTALRNQKTVLLGGDIETVDGPAGPWRIRSEVTDRGYWACIVYPPGGGRLRSIAAVETYLADGETGTGTNNATPASSPVTILGSVKRPYPDDAPAWRSHAAVVLQMHVRAYFFRTRVRQTREVATFAETLAHASTLVDKMTEGNRVHFSDHATAALKEMIDVCTRVAGTCVEPPERLLRGCTSPVLQHRFYPLDCVNYPSSQPAVFTPSALTREHVSALATDILADKHSNAHSLAKAVRHESGYPLLVGSLSLPAGARYMTLLGVEVRVFNTTPVITPRHQSALLTSFQPKWLEHVKHMPYVRSVGVYDFHSMRDGEPLGHLILSKLRLQRRGRYYPAISIESIVSQNKKKGYGTAMVEFAKKVLFAGETAEQGFLCGQCLPVVWWEGQLDITRVARAVVLQMSLTQPEYELEEACIIRGNWVDKDEYSPSPDKKKKKA